MKVKNYTCNSWWFKLSVPFVLGNDITAHWLELARRLQILSSSVSLIGHQSLLILPPSMFHFFSPLASTSVLVQSITLGYINCVLSHSVMSDSLWPMECNPPDSSVHGVFQASTLKQIGISFRHLPDLGIEPTSPALGGGFLTTEPRGKPIYNYSSL